MEKGIRVKHGVVVHMMIIELANDPDCLVIINHVLGVIVIQFNT
jgi:hypothetical protein